MIFIDSSIGATFVAGSRSGLGLAPAAEIRIHRHARRGVEAMQLGGLAQDPRWRARGERVPISASLACRLVAA
jgi:hypothetical protein